MSTSGEAAAKFIYSLFTAQYLAFRIEADFVTSQAPELLRPRLGYFERARDALSNGTRNPYAQSKGTHDHYLPRRPGSPRLCGSGAGAP